jgi:hypothetical protein
MTDENDLIPQPETDTPDDSDAPLSETAEAVTQGDVSTDDAPVETPPPSPADVPAESSADFPVDFSPEFAPPQRAESYSSDLDVDAALAAVASLSDVMAEQEAAEQAKVDAEAIAAEEAAQQAIPVTRQVMPRPPLVTLRRGQPASVVPAVLLMGIGAWLTFALTTSAAPDSTAITLVVVAGLILALMAHWLSSGRWSRGVFFFGTLILLNAAALAFLTQPFSPGLPRGWPLLLVAGGLAFVLTAFLTRPRERRMALPGILLILGGLTGLGFGLGVSDGQILASIAPLWPVAVAAVVIVWLLAIMARSPISLRPNRRLGQRRTRQG